MRMGIHPGGSRGMPSRGIAGKGGSMSEEKIADAVRAAAVNNRLSCEKAHELSRNLGLSLKKIGEVCNQLHIKISSCQLGCF